MATELAKERRLGVVDLDTGETVTDHVARPRAEVEDNDRGKKHRSEKSRKTENRTSTTISIDAILAAAGRNQVQAFEMGGANARATITEQTDALKGAYGEIARLQGGHAAQEARMLKLIEGLIAAAEGSAKKYLGDALQSAAKIEGQTAMDLLDKVLTFASGDVGQMIARRLLPASGVDAAQDGTQSGQAAFLRLLGKILMDPEYSMLAAALEETAGPADWLLLTRWAQELGARRADQGA
jgi:hypothetical protein